MRSNIFWGLLLLLAGALFLAGNFLQINMWPYLVPSAIILFGAWLIVGSMRKAPDLEAESVSIPKGNATKGKISLHHGAGKLVVSSGAKLQNIVDGVFTGGVRHAETLSGDTLDVDLRIPEEIWTNGPWFHGQWSPIMWDVKVNSELPLRLNLQTGAGESQVDLRSVQAQDIRLSTGASSTMLTLPENAGKINVNIESGAASVKIQIPANVAARISVESGLAGIHVDTSRFPQSGSGYESRDFGSAVNAADIRIKTGVGAVEIY